MTTDGKAKRMTDKRKGTLRTMSTKSRRPGQFFAWADRDGMGRKVNAMGLRRAAYGDGDLQQWLFERGFPADASERDIVVLCPGREITIAEIMRGWEKWRREAAA